MPLAAPAIAQNKPIRLGWIAAVTGIFATNAQAQDWGFRMAVQDINEAGGILGRKLEVVMRDSAADPGKAVSYAKELVFNQDIDVLCGPINSGEALPTLATVSGAKKLHLIGGSVEELIDPVKYPLAFRNLNTNGQWIKVAVKAMIQDMKRTKVAIINDNTGYGVLARDAVTKFFDAAQPQAGVHGNGRSEQAGRDRRGAESQEPPGRTSSRSGRTPPVLLRAC